MINISYCIEQLTPNALYHISNYIFNTDFTDEIYNDIVWNDTRDKPSLYDIKVVWFNYLKEVKINEVNILRDQKIADGIPYLFPDGIQGTIQTRDVVDHRNIQANGSAAQIFIMQEMYDYDMKFRDTENVVHILKPSQMLDMSMHCMGYGQQIYEVSWYHKDNIDQMTIIEEDIVLSLSNIENYDVTIGWDF